MTYLEETELLKAEYRQKTKEISEKSLTSKGRDSYASKERHEAMLWFMREVDKLQQKYNIKHSE